MTAIDRQRFAALADVLIPAAQGMPSASEVGVHREGLDRVLAVRPDLEPALARATASEGDSSEALRALQRDDDAAFAALALAVTGAYYVDAAVRRLIGYPGQQYRPELVSGEPDWDEAELARVIARGPVYRPVPDS